MRPFEIITDLGWMNFKSFCNDHNWIQPIIDWSEYTTTKSIIDDILKQPVDILCLSTYLWNHKICTYIAKEIKKINEKIIIIRGGPHQGYKEGFFDEHPYIDYMCYATGHGENFMKAALEQIEKYGKIVDPKKVPHIISRDYQSLIEKSKFVYPQEYSLETNLDYIIEALNISKLKNKKFKLMYETTRGCPYSCTYCEWGGGISTKVSIKPLDVIKKDIDLISLMKIEHLEFVDANVGILDRDVEIIEHIGQNKLKYGYPKTLHIYGVAKVKLSKKEAILDKLLEYELYPEVTISVQSIDKKLLENIKRTDIDLEENLYLLKKYKGKYGKFHQPKIEILLGIPGYTLDHFYKEMDYYYEYSSLKSERYLLSLLPDSEMFSSFQRKMWKIKTITIGGDDFFRDCPIEEKSNFFSGKDNFLNDDRFMPEYEIVTSTFSYTEQEWKEMFFMNVVMKVLEREIKPGDKPSILFKKIFDERIRNKEWYRKFDDHLNLILEKKNCPNDIGMFNGISIEEYAELNLYGES
jgi:putative methyltransferase